MKIGLGGCAVVLAVLGGCAVPTSVEEGGANANDRTFGGEAGERLLTGAMQVSPSGHFAIMQRNTQTVVLDIAGESTVELPQQLLRVALSKARDVGYALQMDGSIVALDLATSKELWRAEGPYAAVSILRVTDDDATVLVVDGAAATLLDGATGETRVVTALPSPASFATLMPVSGNALVVGRTTWNQGKPSTPVVMLDLDTADATTVDVPNCAAPISVLPDESRALLSPTFCEMGKAENPDDKWTNPDPVSVIDIAHGELSFVKNLPGFGPVALTPEGDRAVAYLDTTRIDRSMFADASQIPGANAPQYHLLVIDPVSLAFTVSPIGPALPRFAMSRDGHGLLVDSSIKVIHRSDIHADATVSLDGSGISGQVDASAKVFDEQTPFGWFDLDTKKFVGFSGAAAGLDRFVQLGDGKTVVTLQKRADGLGGVPYRIDLDASTTSPLEGDYGTGVRDIGLLPDGQTLLLRFRQPAATIGTNLYARETYCLSLDGLTCAGGRIEYQASVAFASTETNDCGNMGHDCW